MGPESPCDLCCPHLFSRGCTAKEQRSYSLGGRWGSRSSKAWVSCLLCIQRKGLMSAKRENECQPLAGTLQCVLLKREKPFSGLEGKWYFLFLVPVLVVQSQIQNTVWFQCALLDQHRQILLLITALFATLSKQKISITVLGGVLVTCAVVRSQKVLIWHKMGKKCYTRQFSPNWNLQKIRNTA